MSEKGQGQNGGGAAGAGAGAGTAPPQGPPEATDPSGSAPQGRGGGGQQANQKKEPTTGGSTTFADGGKLELKDGKWRYTDPGCRTGLWQGTDSWVDESSGQPMPSDFEGRAPDSQGLEEGLRQREGR